MKSAERGERMQKQGQKRVTYSDTTDMDPTGSRVEEKHEGESINEGAEVFEGLCDRMLSALSLVQTSVSEVLDLKDEVLVQNVPSSLQTLLSLCTARLFRSLLDLYVPSRELVRLVRVFGPQWEQNLLTLKQLQEEHERLQRLLSLAMHRVQNLEAQSHRDARGQPNRNWEKLFVRLMRMGPYKPSQEMIQELEGSSSRGQTTSQDTRDAALHKSPFARNGM
eukprot:XP_002937677.1 PREDICTED: uncharacterized protein LOC100497696 [Xenopus tropicalis]